MNPPGKSEHVKWKRWRTTLVILAFICGGLVLEGRIFYLQFYQREFLSAQGDDRSQRILLSLEHLGLHKILHRPVVPVRLLRFRRAPLEARPQRGRTSAE